MRFHFAAIGILLIAHTVHAASLTIDTTVNWAADNCTVFPRVCEGGISGTDTVNYNDGATVIDVGVDSQTSAAYGELNASARAFAGVLQYPGDPQAKVLIPSLAMAQVSLAFSDAITIFGPAEGLIEFEVFNNTFDSPDPFPNATVFNEFGIAGDLQQLNPFVHLFSAVFHQGQAVTFSGHSFAAVSDFAPDDAGAGGDAVFAGLRISSIRLKSMNGDPLDSWFYATESGTIYPTLDGTAVPEPASLAFVLGGFLLFAAKRWTVQCQ